MRHFIMAMAHSNSSLHSSISRSIHHRHRWVCLTMRRTIMHSRRQARNRIRTLMPTCSRLSQWELIRASMLSVLCNNPPRSTRADIKICNHRSRPSTLYPRPTLPSSLIVSRLSKRQSSHRPGINTGNSSSNRIHSSILRSSSKAGSHPHHNQVSMRRRSQQLLSTRRKLSSQ